MELTRFPPGSYVGARDGHSAKPYHLKFALFKRANLAGCSNRSGYLGMDFSSLNLRNLSRWTQCRALTVFVLSASFEIAWRLAKMPKKGA